MGTRGSARRNATARHRHRKTRRSDLGKLASNHAQIGEPEEIARGDPGEVPAFPASQLDGSVVAVGGRNVGDGYCAAQRISSQHRDRSGITLERDTQ
jgi:hypothetical protein